jgi:hypothetical protein
MQWTSRAVRTDQFDVAVPSNTYMSGGYYFPITIVGLNVSVKFRGLLLHVVNSRNVSVGQFTIKPSTFGFRINPNCPNAVFHLDASEKTYKMTFAYKTPDPGAGTLRIQVLLKTGPANTGAFWWPRAIGDIYLHEVAAPNPATQHIVWVQSLQNGNCNDACDAIGRTCDCYHS